MLSQTKLKFIVGLGIGIYVALFVLALPVFAEEQSGLSKKLEAVELKIPFGDLPKVFSEAKVEPCVPAGYDCKGNANCELQKKNYCAQIPWIAIYIGAVYRYAVIIGSVIAVLVIMIGGIMYLLAGFDRKLVTTGQDMMKNATFGLILLLSSYLILNAINPNLVKLKPITVESVKPQKLSLVKFCNELNSSAYEITGSQACGAKAQFTSKDTSVVDKGECLGYICDDTKTACLPAGDTPGYFCKKVLVWGYVSDPESRYLDEVCLYLATGKPEKVFCDDSFDKGSLMYYLSLPTDQAKAQEVISEINNKEIVLKVELNDSATETMKMAYGSAGSIVTPIAPTIDDEYYVGKKKGAPPEQGYWINPECNVCPVVSFVQKGKGAGWEYSFDCQYYSAFQMLNGGIRVDIDAGKFQEDSVISCDLVDKLTVGVEKLPAGTFGCKNNEQCASGDCETEKGKTMCECNKDEDCPTGQRCQTYYATWNICLTGLPVGVDCKNDDVCVSQECDDGKCVCTKDAHCGEKEVCHESENKCESGKAVGVPCTDGWQCLGEGDCESDSWYDIGTDEKKCECNQDSDCGKGKQCITIEDGCGWNYCISQQGGVFSVPENYPSIAESDFKKLPEDEKRKGLCDKNAQCISKDCNTDWGKNDCNACE